tara:strand:- start:3831 stop:4022 length:192 start_codon:yes stop_codon:yes gene_type:complete
MAFYIKKPHILDSTKDMYYEGNRHWSDNPLNKKEYVDADSANAEMVNPDGKNGGWTGAQVLSE